MPKKVKTNALNPSPDWRSWCEQGRLEEQEEGGQAGHHRHRHVRTLLAPHTGHCLCKHDFIC